MTTDFKLDLSPLTEYAASRGMDDLCQLACTALSAIACVDDLDLDPLFVSSDLERIFETAELVVECEPDASDPLPVLCTQMLAWRPAALSEPALARDFWLALLPGRLLALRIHQQHRLGETPPADERTDIESMLQFVSSLADTAPVFLGGAPDSPFQKRDPEALFKDLWSRFSGVFSGENNLSRLACQYYPRGAAIFIDLAGTPSAL